MTTATTIDWNARYNAGYYRERWEPGEQAFFEYHCWESLDSQDADLWLRSHQQVTVLGEIGQHDGDWTKTYQERFQDCLYVLYKVRFDDGHVGTVYEEELFTTPDAYYRPDPPKDREDDR